MTDREIIELWRQALAIGEEVYLATVVFVEGSSYRKPGARMLVTSSGKRAGTVSGGCLEAEVAKKIGWLTTDGPAIQKYRSSFDDETEGVPYGLGCGGTIWILMESGEQAALALQSLESAIDRRTSSVIVVSLRGPELGTIAAICPNTHHVRGFRANAEIPEEIFDAAREVARTRQASHVGILGSSDLPSHILIPILPPMRLHVFGAGDDASPLVRFAIELGWQVTVWDGRSHLLRQNRFPLSVDLRLISYRDSEATEQGNSLQVQGVLTDVLAEDFAVILTHSYAQDGALLQALIPKSLRYLGILGPVHRTRRLLNERAYTLHKTVEEALELLHAPVGLEIGSYHPTVIALSIIAEMQAVLSRKRISVTAASD